MIQAASPAMSEIASATQQLRLARSHEPHPLHPGAGEVVRFVSELQAAHLELGSVLDQNSLPSAEEGAVRRKRKAIDAAIRRQVLLAGRRMGSDREGSMATLNALFRLGHAPDPALNGRFAGDLVSPALFAPLDSFGRLFTRLWLPWLGKRFFSDEQRGDNVFNRSASVVGHLFWPTFSDYRPYLPGLVTAFDFKTYTGPGVHDPDTGTLKLDYSDESNPALLVRQVLDELVQITSGYYLGKAYLTTRDGDYRLAAVFALRQYDLPRNQKS